jgi:hypothetical protein
MPRGRSKQGYGNRTDLANKVGGEMAYGEKAKLMAGQKDVPMANAATSVPEAAPAEAMAAQAPAQPQVTPIPLTAPTQRPNENILAGMSQSRSQNTDLQKLKSMQPLFEAEALADDAPEMFREFVGWLRLQ